MKLILVIIFSLFSINIFASECICAGWCVEVEVEGCGNWGDQIKSKEYIEKSGSSLITAWKELKKSCPFENLKPTLYTKKFAGGKDCIFSNVQAVPMNSCICMNQ